MGTKFNFNSAICTSREQSERLLALGLKKETADMTWHFSYMMKGEPQYDLLAESTWDEDTIHRYVEHGIKMTLFDHWKHSDGTQMTPLEIYAEITKKDIPAWSLHRLLCLYNCHYLEFMGETEIASAYDIVIEAIESAITGGYFNEKYLE